MFEKLLETNLINFIIMFSLLALIFKKAKLGDAIARLADDTKRKIDESSKKAANALYDYEQTKEGSKNVALTQEKIIKDAKNTAAAMEKNIHRETALCEEELEESFKGLAQSHGAKAKKHALESVYGACITLAYDEVIKNLDDETHRHLIESGIDEISRMEKICL